MAQGIMVQEADSSIRTLKPSGELDYYDHQSILLPFAITPLEAWNIATGGPKPILKLAFKVRDMISSRFDVQRIGGFSGSKVETVQAGDRLDFFLVEDVAPNRLILTVRDRHLDVMICLLIKDCVLSVTASVVTHNAFGRAYMLPVGPVHKIIVKRDLMHLAKVLTRRSTSG
ncbi:DUF2867 domain-containing protein [Affinirhizobium rhizoryzae]|uniref:DUF2867 domain-containing protein n=1 Tax=Rhizobium rhizoryzae TaxID=451876 RepID=UPI001FE67C8A|nr:DUF2867 domain-containing protein [Rhizobium rhizoryzae]